MNYIVFIILTNMLIYIYIYIYIYIQNKKNTHIFTSISCTCAQKHTQYIYIYIVCVCVCVCVCFCSHVHENACKYVRWSIDKSSYVHSFSIVYIFFHNELSLSPLFLVPFSLHGVCCAVEESSTRP